MLAADLHHYPVVTSVPFPEVLLPLVQLAVQYHLAHRLMNLNQIYYKEFYKRDDIDLVVKYGNGCRGLDRIRFMNALEDKLNKTVDVLNVDFLPDFFKDIDLQSEERLIYAK